MAEFARLWTSFTGRRVIGLTTSTNAARVLEHEGLAESYNVAEFLGRTEGTDELRRPVPYRDDVLVLDEASQLSTTGLAVITEAARQAGARVTATGDTAQLGAVEVPWACSACSPARSPPCSCMRSAGSRRSGTPGEHPAPRRRPGRGGRLRPARPRPRRRQGGRLRPRRLDVARGPPARQDRAAARRVQRRSRRSYSGACKPGSSSSARSGSRQVALSDGRPRRASAT